MTVTVSSRTKRIVAFAVVCVLALGGASAYALLDLDRQRDRIADAPKVEQTDAAAVQRGPRIVFRNTAIGNDYGLVATVSLDDPGGARAIGDVACDRIDATATAASCLATERGVVTKYAWLDLDADLRETGKAPLTGLPSRTRLSPDGTLAASTVFVAGHSYMQTGFSTATVIREVGGASRGNLEKFDLVIDDQVVSPTDRNFWGVTFADDNIFYATVETDHVKYLVEGDLTARTMTAIHKGVECPAISPDGSRIAYKADVGKGGQTHWTPAVLDLDTMKSTLLEGETDTIDDQITWLDDDTILYAKPRADEAGVTDVFSVDTETAAAPSLLVPQAWSPAVVREAAR